MSVTKNHLANCLSEYVLEFIMKFSKSICELQTIKENEGTNIKELKDELVSLGSKRLYFAPVKDKLKYIKKRMSKIKVNI